MLGIGTDIQFKLRVRLGCTPWPARAVRNFMRARYSRVRTAPGLMPSWLAISSVENPISTCSTSGSRYSASSASIAAVTSE